MASQRLNKVQRFTDLQVWRKSHDLFLKLLLDLEGTAEHSHGHDFD